MDTKKLNPCKMCGVPPELMHSHGFRFDMTGMVYKCTCPRCGRNTKAYESAAEAFAEWNKENKEADAE